MNPSEISVNPKLMFKELYEKYWKPIEIKSGIRGKAIQQYNVVKRLLDSIRQVAMLKCGNGIHSMHDFSRPDNVRYIPLAQRYFREIVEYILAEN